jgi:hypothetical protein
MLHQNCVVVSKRFLDLCCVEMAHIFEERSTITCLTGNYCVIYIETVCDLRHFKFGQHKHFRFLQPLVSLHSGQDFADIIANEHSK